MDDITQGMEFYRKHLLPLGLIEEGSVPSELTGDCRFMLTFPKLGWDPVGRSDRDGTAEVFSFKKEIMYGFKDWDLRYPGTMIVLYTSASLKDISLGGMGCRDARKTLKDFGKTLGDLEKRAQEIEIALIGRDIDPLVEEGEQLCGRTRYTMEMYLRGDGKPETIIDLYTILDRLYVKRP